MAQSKGKNITGISKVKKPRGADLRSDYSLEKYFSGFSNEERIILNRKAQILALGKNDENEKSGDSIDVIDFDLSGETYGIEIKYVKETIKLKRCTPLPNIPDFILGLINYRGLVIAVVDLKIFFDLKTDPISELTRVIILEGKEFPFGILADRVCEIQAIEKNKLTTHLPSLNGKREEYLLGIAENGVIILDTQKIINDPSLIIETEI